MKQKKFYETKEFKELEKEWNEKLEDSGFFDIESEKDKEHNCIQKQTFLPSIDKANYAVECRALLESGKIKNKIDLFIFQKHCENFTVRQIERLLKKNKGMPELTFKAVSNRIKKILKLGFIQPVDLKN